MLFDARNISVLATQIIGQNSVDLNRSFPGTSSDRLLTDRHTPRIEGDVKTVSVPRDPSLTLRPLSDDVPVSRLIFFRSA